MQMTMMGRIRKLFEGMDADQGAGDEREVGLSMQLELLTAAGAQPLQEIVRVGRSFYTGTVAAIAAVAAVPTTAVMLALYNTEEDGGKTGVIDWVGAINVASTAVVAQAQLLGLVGQIREVMPTDAALAIKKCNGMGPKTDSVMSTILAATALPVGTGILGNWLPLGGSVTKPSAVATPGYGLHHEIDGGLSVAPGRYFAMHVQANVVGETFLIYVGWHEKQLLNG